jgi:hypothetical protein
MPFYKKAEANQGSFHDGNADFDSEDSAGDRVGCHGALENLALAKLEVEFRPELANDRLAKRSGTLIP